MLTEICAASVSSALNAQNGGAQRIELCAELAVGGITPSFGMLKEALGLLQIPVFVLIRPRSGDFNYSALEFEVMKKDIQLCRELGCAGVVSGVLNEDNTIDNERTGELIKLTGPLEFTFHRAFDQLTNAEEGIKQLIDLGADRILTSGLESNAESGLENLVRLKKLADKKIIILPGGGIHSGNVQLFKTNGFTEIHASASSVVKGVKQAKIPMNSPKFFDETKQFESDLAKIKAIVSQALD